MAVSVMTILVRNLEDKEKLDPLQKSFLSCVAVGTLQ